VLAGRAISMPFRTRHHRFVTVNHGHSRSSDLRRPYYDLRPTASRTRRPALLAAELAVSSYGEVAARVAAAGEPRWLIQGLWPADAYGVLAAKAKAGKTWAALGAGSELADMQAELEAHPAALWSWIRCIWPQPGPAAPTLRHGRCPPAIQGVCQHAGCALLVVTHWNKTGDGRDADRISGAGPAAWARVICSVAVHYRGSDQDGASAVVLGVELIGGEIPDTRFRIGRRVRAEDPADLGAQLFYAVEVLAADEDEDLEPAAAALSKSRQWVLTALRAGGDMQTVKQLGDRLAQAGHPLKPRTIQTALGELEAAGLAAGSEEGSGRARYWSPATPKPGCRQWGATINRAKVGESTWHDHLASVLQSFAVVGEWGGVMLPA
jgi:Fe2+ or Zn2+ uptake regulation protein